MNIVINKITKREMKTGDVVRLKGDPMAVKMTVHRVSETVVDCVWFVNRTLYERTFQMDSLIYA